MQQLVEADVIARTVRPTSSRPPDIGEIERGPSDTRGQQGASNALVGFRVVLRPFQNGEQQGINEAIEARPFAGIKAAHLAPAPANCRRQIMSASRFVRRRS